MAACRRRVISDLAVRRQCWQSPTMRTLALSCLLALASPAFAETPITAERFEELVTGKTLTFSTAAGPYGIEYYAPNRRVIWSFIGGECETGEWYEEARDLGPSICFAYENNPDPQCWYVYDVDGQIRADFAGATGGSFLYQLDVSEPLVCGGVGA